MKTITKLSGSTFITEISDSNKNSKNLVIAWEKYLKNRLLFDNIIK